MINIMERKRMMLATILIVILLAVGYSVYWFIEEIKYSNVPVEGIPDETEGEGLLPGLLTYQVPNM